MVRWRQCGWLVLGLMLAGDIRAADSLRVASHNIHYMRPDHPDDDWPDRRDAVIDVITDIKPDILAFQEMETFAGGHSNDVNQQLDWVLAHHPQFRPGAFSEDADTFPITQPILYRHERLQRLDQGFFFFSETPDTLYSRQWDGGYPYFASWIKLAERASGQVFYVFNMHNDYASRSNRMASSALVAERIVAIAGDAPVILLGDLNAPAYFREVEYFANYGLRPVKPGGSTNRILGLKLLPAIDHILINPGFSATGSVSVWDDRYGGQYPSDHFPISADLLFAPR